MMWVSEPVSHFQARLRAPTCGLPSMPQAMAVRIGGMKNGSVISTSRVRRAGVSVRATIQARKIAVSSDGMVLASEIATVFRRTLTFSAVRMAR